MAREHTLLERIAASSGRQQGRSSGPTAKEDVHALMESVRRHLNKLLNARHGMSEAQPDYGLPAFSDLRSGSGDNIQLMQQAIQNAIEKYEPRLRRARVSRVVDEENRQDSLSFRVDAVLVGRDAEHRVWYQTKVTGKGRFDVEE